MYQNRRGFVRNAGFAAGATLLFRQVESFAVTASTISGSNEILDSTDLEVIRWVQHYSHRLCLHGGGIAGKLSGSHRRETQIVAEIVGHHQLMDVLLNDAGLPSNPVHAHGNHLSFTRGGTFFSIENLEQDQFQNRIDTIASGTLLGSYEHELLIFQPSESTLVDPRNISGGGSASKFSLRPVHKVSPVTGGGWYQILRGLRHMESFHLEASPEFRSVLDASLGTPVSSHAEAAELVEAIVKNTAALANEGGSSWLEKIMDSAAVASAFSGYSGRSSIAIGRSFSALRRKAGNTAPDAAIWLAVLLEGESDRGLRGQALFIDDADPKAAIDTISVLRHANSLMQQPGFRSMLNSAGASSGQAQTFQRFQATTGLTNSDAADSDGDGIPDLIEYGLGTDPGMMTTTGLPEMRSECIGGEDFLTLYYTRDTRLADIVYEPQTSQNLKDWTTAGVVDEALPGANVTGIVNYRAAVPLFGRRRYLRLAVRRRF